MTVKKIHWLEDTIEKGLFTSRWLMAPVYIGLVFALIFLLMSYLLELYHFGANILHATQTDVVLGILSLIDLSLTGNLILIVIFSGYENFVSKMNTEGHEDHPEWKGSVDFSTLKLKIVSSIVAISGIHLLRVFMDVGKVSITQVQWMVIIHMVFVVSGVLLAVMDRIAVSTKAIKEKY